MNRLLKTQIEFPPVRLLPGVMILLLLFSQFLTTNGQNQTVPSAEHTSPSLAKYLDQVNGRTADDLVAAALADNGEITGLRKEVEAAEALVKQAGLRPNPTLETSGTRQIGGPDNSVMIAGSLPLELGGRRAARVRVAERELELRQLALADRERLLAAEVRSRFGETLAAAFKLKFAEEMLTVATDNYNLVAATVAEGRRPPLEQNVETVELNRLRVIRETSEGSVEIKLFELRNLVGTGPEEPLRLRGNFENLLDVLQPRFEATDRALLMRPDLRAARTMELLAAARIQQARAAGKVDASLTAGYQRMRSSFPLQGFDPQGSLRPIDSVFNFVTFGVMLDLPIRNRNQGAVAAAIADEAAATSRREFGELTIRREVASAYTKYERSMRAMEIYRVGVREQAAANLTVVRQTYELGSKPLFDYIAEHHRFIEIENGYIDAQLETYLARVDIWRATVAPELKGSSKN